MEVSITKQEKTITLSNKDRDLIRSALSNPPEPNDTLIDLFKASPPK